MPVHKFFGKTVALLLCILFLLHPGNPVFGQKKPKWRVKNRLQLSYEFDNNIRENPSDSLDRIEDSSARFLFSSKASRSGEKIALRFAYQGGLQTYFQHSIENKLINGIRATAILNLQKFRVGLRGAGRLKIYLNDILDYSTGSLESFVRRHFGALPMSFLSESKAESTAISRSSTTRKLAWDGLFRVL